MRSKDESVKMLKRFIEDCKILGIKIARIQTDRGSEFFEQEGVGAHYDLRQSHAFGEICRKAGIQHTVTPVGDKEKIAERWIKEHFKTVDLYLWEARLAPQFWTYALNYSVYQANRTPKIIGSEWYKSPIEIITGEVPRWDNYITFGCDVYS